MLDEQQKPLSEEQSVTSGVKAENVETKVDNVSYETHKRLLGEKKKLQERLDSLESQWKARQEEELKAQNKYQSLYESTLKERDEYMSKLKEQDSRWNNAIKLDAFMNALGGRKIESKYASFINLDSINLDEDTGSVDSLTVQKEIERICRDFPEIVKVAVQPKQLPSEAPKNPLRDSNASVTSRDKIREAARFLSKNR